MNLKPWHAFPLVALLVLIGRDFRIGGPEDFAAFVLGSALFGAIGYGLIWMLQRGKQ